MAAARLAQIQGKMKSAGCTAWKYSRGYYQEVMEQNKHFVEEPPTIEKCSELSKRLFYTRLASLPQRYESFWKEIDVVKQKLKNRHDLTVEEVGVGVLFGLECYAWGCVGEIVGRGFTITGYYP